MKKLAIAKTPITAFLHEAYTCNLVLNESDGYVWLYDTWIQWEWRSSVLDGCMPETITWRHPMTKWYAIPNELLAKSGTKFIDLIKNAVDHDFYVTTCVNKNKLDVVSGGSDRHDLLIHGYDDEKNEVYVMAYDQRGKYRECICSFNEIAEAYEKVGSQILWDEDTIVLIKRKSHPLYQADMTKICNLLEDYLCSRSCWWRFNGGSCANSDDPNQGLNAYDRVVEYARRINEDNVNLDIRSFCTIRDHKYVMIERIKYLERMEYISSHLKLSQRYNIIYRDAERVKLLAMKYMITTDFRLVEFLARLLSKMKEEERLLLEELLSHISQRC